MDTGSDKPSVSIMSDITNDQSIQQLAPKRNGSVIFESIPENKEYQPTYNDENSPFPLKSSLSVKKIQQQQQQQQNDKKVCFENSPVVVEYDKLSSEDEYSLRNSNSQQSVSSGGSSAQKIATNFQLNWKPSSTSTTNPSDAAPVPFKHSQHPKPLPPMPANLPQSESLQQDLQYFHHSSNDSDSNQFNFADLNVGNDSEIYPQASIAIPKLRTKKQDKDVNYDGELIDSEAEESGDLDVKMQDLNIVDKNISEKALEAFIDNSNSTVNRFDFSAAPVSPSRLEQKKNLSAAHFEDTLDSVLPPDRTPSTIIKDNHKLYNKYRTDNNNNRSVSSSSDKYYDDVILDTVRQNVNNAFNGNRDSIKRKSFAKIAEENESSNGGESSKDEFTIGDYMNDSKQASGVRKSRDIFEDIEITDPTSSSNQSIPQKQESRVTSIDSSVPLGESTVDFSQSYTPFQNSNNFDKIDENIGEDVKEASTPDYDVSHDHSMQDGEELSPIETDHRLHDYSIHQDDSDAFIPFSQSVFNDKKSDSNNDSGVFDESNDSGASNFTLKLMQMKKEKEQSISISRLENSINGPNNLKPMINTVNITPPPAQKIAESPTTITDTPRSLAPTRLTNSVLDTLLTKTNQYTAQSGIDAPPIKFDPDSSVEDKPPAKTKIFSGNHNFQKPNKPIFDQPQFPRSPTQDSLSSTEDVHNIWATLKNKTDNNNEGHRKASTIRSQSMKSSPSMNSLEIKKILKAKKKIGSRGGSKRYHVSPSAQKHFDESINTDLNGRLGGGHFIDDTVDRGDSDGIDIDDDLDIDDEEEDNEEGPDILSHIKDELSKVPKPLLPEQHFGNLSDFEQEFTQEMSKYDDGDDSENKGYTTRINNNELIVAKLESAGEYEEDEDSFMKDQRLTTIKIDKKKIQNEYYNNKKPHIYKGMVNKPQQREIKVSSGSHSGEVKRKSRNTSKESGATSYVSAKDHISTKDVKSKKRKSGTSEKTEIRFPSNSSYGESYYERQISAPKSHRVSVSTKRGQSLRGSIHGDSVQDQTNNGFHEGTILEGQILEDDLEQYDPQEPIIQDSEQNYFDINLPKDDQGRLYVRIVGLKHLNLPDVAAHNAKFSLILDNGIHCISTPEVNLNTNTSINQEFELTVSDNLEFILTLKASYEFEGEEKLIEITEKYPVRKRVLGGLLGHKTIYKTRKRVVTKVDKTDSWDNMTAKDGSFARAYVDFAQYEPLITGKACNFDVTCFNEWESYVEKGQVKKRQPYRIGKLELQMLYIPRTKVNEVFPPSIHIAYEAVKEYQNQLHLQYEGFLSQEGGDCNYLKRRWFTLSGTDLIAHNEFSKKTRAKINLIKAVGLISSNIKKHYTANPENYAGRRLSDEIIMHQGFKIKFMNGETIEFVADSQYEKMNWLKILDQVISKNKFRQPWIKILYDQLS